MTASEALARWARFPVEREPRPVVLTELPMAALEELAQDTEWRARFDGPGEPESALPPSLRPAAIDYCRDVQTASLQPLATLLRAPAPFGTDRGIREFPAWLMHPPDRRWPFIAMEPEFRRRMTWWPEGLQPYGEEVSRIAPDGHTLTYRFSGAPTPYADYPRAEVYESETAVFIEPIGVSLIGQDDAVLEYLEEREVVVRLAEPLGNRVLIWAAHGPDSDTFGAPRTVLPA